MTVGRNNARTRLTVLALIAALAITVLGATGCVLDPDGGASLGAKSKSYAPIAVKEQVFASLEKQGYMPSSPGDTYMSYPDMNDTATVLVDGTFFGPSKEKGVLASYSSIEVKKSEEGSWTIVKTTAGTAKRPKAGAEEGKSEEPAKKE